MIYGFLNELWIPCSGEGVQLWLKEDLRKRTSKKEEIAITSLFFFVVCVSFLGKIIPAKGFEDKTRRGHRLIGLPTAGWRSIAFGNPLRRGRVSDYSASLRKDQMLLDSVFFWCFLLLLLYGIHFVYASADGSARWFCWTAIAGWSRYQKKM